MAAERSEHARSEAIEASRPSCVWAAHHDGVTCIEATDRAGFWCLACKRATVATSGGTGQAT